MRSPSRTIATWCQLLGSTWANPGQESFALVSLVNEESPAETVGPSDSKVIALGGFQAIPVRERKDRRSRDDSY